MKKIFSSAQIRYLDSATIIEESIDSIQLMERAGLTSFQWLKNHYGNGVDYLVICGPGNNGGDGLVISRLLAGTGVRVSYIILGDSEKCSRDNLFNQDKIRETGANEISLRQVDEMLEKADGNYIIIDALFGSGLNSELKDSFKAIVESINTSNLEVVSIDLPSGMQANKPSEGVCIKAKYTLSFQVPRLAFFMSENEDCLGEFHVLDIGLSKIEMQNLESDYYQIQEEDIRAKNLTRKRHSHKGNYGHALIVAGSQGKFGAAILCVEACTRSGVGLVTTCVPDNMNSSINLSSPEAMTLNGAGMDHLVNLPGGGSYNCIGIGPGIGTNPETAFFVKQVIQVNKIPLVMDADAINILSDNRSWLEIIIPNSILTPHPGEFKRLCGEYTDGFKALELAKKFAIKFKVIIVLKGAYSAVVSPQGKVFFNSTGNPGMAIGGAGDVLTGLITGLVARGYTPLDAAIRGVYIHGLAGDLAAREKGLESMNTRDILYYLPSAMKRLEQNIATAFPIPD